MHTRSCLIPEGMLQQPLIYYYNFCEQYLILIFYQFKYFIPYLSKSVGFVAENIKWIPLHTKNIRGGINSYKLQWQQLPKTYKLENRKIITYNLNKQSNRTSNPVLLEMTSPTSTARFNFGANDSEFLNRNSGAISFGQPNTSQIQSSFHNSQNATSIQPSHLSFGYPASNVRTDLNVVNVRNTADGTRQISSSSIPTYTPNIVVTAHNSTQMPAMPPPQPIVNSGQAPKMTVLHRPDVYSINMDKTSANTFSHSLQTIKQERSQGSSLTNIRSTQGYNLSQAQKLQYEREKALQDQAKCCLFFRKKKN